MIRGLITTFVLLVILLSCQGCGAPFHLKRAKYHENKAIALGAKVEEKTDTVFKYVNVPVPEIKVDTVFAVTNDTITFTKDSIQYKILIRDKKVYFHVQSKPKYFRVKQTIFVNKTKTISSGYTTFDIIKWCLFVAVASVLLGKLFWK